MRPPRQLGTLKNYITDYDSYTLLLLFINVVYRRGRKITTFFRSLPQGCILLPNRIILNICQLHSG
jgi:hypothetical protein